MAYAVKSKGTVVTLYHDSIPIMVADIRYCNGYHQIKEQEALSAFHDIVYKRSKYYVEKIQSQESGPR